MEFADVYVQPQAPDEVWSDAQVLALAREFAPGARRVTGVDESGGEARTYAVDDGLILKTQRPHRLRPRTGLEKEAFFLRQLAERSDVPVPRVLGHAKKSNLIEYTLMTRMPGAAMSRTALSGEALAAALEIHGRMLRRIHSLPLGPFRESGLFPDDGTAENVRGRFLYRFGRTLDGLAPAVAPDELARARALGAEIAAEIPARLTLAPLHSNPYREHTFVHADGTYSGVIDFGDAYLSHPVGDLRRWSPAERRLLLRGYLSEGPVGDDFMPMWRVLWQLDAAADLLKKTGSLRSLGSRADLMNWE